MKEVMCCSACGLIVQDSDKTSKLKCPRCETNLKIEFNSIEYDLALSITALILFYPAMTYPILSFQLGGNIQDSNMFSSIITFYDEGYVLLSLLVLFTVVLAPLVQICISILLFGALHGNRKPAFMRFYFKTLQVLRHWVMLDVYIIAIIVSIVKLSDTSEVIYGKGLILFTALSICSFFLNICFSPHKTWKAYYATN